MSKLIVKIMNFLLAFIGNQHLVQFSPIRKVSFQHTKKDDFNTPC